MATTAPIDDADEFMNVFFGFYLVAANVTYWSWYYDTGTIDSLMTQESRGDVYMHVIITRAQKDPFLFLRDKMTMDVALAWSAMMMMIPRQYVLLGRIVMNLIVLALFQSPNYHQDASTFPWSSFTMVTAMDGTRPHHSSSSSSSSFHRRRKPLPRNFPTRHHHHHHHYHAHNSSSRMTIANMTCDTFEQPLNHFVPRGQSPTYPQRYCSYQYSTNHTTTHHNTTTSTTPILFYTGNESPLEQYINNTGLMWELASELHAQVVFAEHRYEGHSLPSLSTKCMSYSSSAQALEDFVALLEHLNPKSHRPVVAFGGSYGGMLSAWLRMKYPSSVAGAIAASAPIWGLPKAALSQHYAMDASWQVITRGLSLPYPPTLTTTNDPQHQRQHHQAPSSSSSNYCAHNLRAAWPLMYYMGRSSSGRQALQSIFRLCHPLESKQDADILVAWAQGLWFDLAEGSFPYPSSYLPFSIHLGIYNLPAWPLQYACWNSSRLSQDLGVRVDGNISNVLYNVTYGDENDDGLVLHVDWDHVTPLQHINDDEDYYYYYMSSSNKTVIFTLLSNVRDAVSIWYNITKDVECYNISSGWSDSGAAAPLSNSQLLPKSQQEEQKQQSPRAEQERALLPSSSDNSAKICHDKMVAEGSWNSLCCNEDINMLPTLGFGLGRDFLWPPSQPRHYQYPSELFNDTSCADPNGIFGYPTDADPMSSWLDLYYGGVRIGASSNIVFSNGLLDPWSAAGVYGKDMNPNNHHDNIVENGTFASYSGPMVQNVTKDGSVIALILEYGGHHTDLMYSDPLDPECIRKARHVERERVIKWIDEWQLIVR